MLIGDLPRVTLGRSFLTDPMEAVGDDLSETPSTFPAARVLTELDDVLTLGPSDPARVVLVDGSLQIICQPSISGSKTRNVVPYIMDGAGRLA